MPGALARIDAAQLQDVFAAVRRRFPGALVENIRIGSDLVVVGGSDVVRRYDMTIREPEKSTLARMKGTAIAEATRIEIMQRDLVEAGHRDAASEQQLRLRDDFDAMARLIELIEGDRVILNRIVELQQKKK